jgi:hypothetical protein
MFSLKNRFFMTPDEALSLGIWGTASLSTMDKLISPRPLGLTHILLIHAPSASDTPVTGIAGAAPRRPNNRTLNFPNVVELPINDLLFLLNVPNLSSRGSAPVLPHRLQKELPRVIMHVPHLETFPELVIYLHTMNQAELFRALIPEWIRDIMHPLPIIAVGNSNAGVVAQEHSASCKPRKLLCFLGCCLCSDTSSSVTLSNPLKRGGKTIHSISKEISDATALMADGINPVLHAASLLDALRDNLDFLGYYGKVLWNELDVCHEILIRAISWKARVDVGDQKE